MKVRSLLLALVLCLGSGVVVVATSGSTAGVGGQRADGAFAPLALFDDYADGSLRGQGPWSVNTTGAADGALVSDVVPGDLSGKAMVDQLTGFDEPVRYRGNASAALGALAVPDGSSATLFLQVQATDLARTDLHLGLSSNPTPGLGMDTTTNPFDLDDYGPEVTLGPSGLVARDGDTDRVLSGLAIRAGVLYRLWLTVDNASDTFEVHAAAPGGAPVLLGSAGRSTFGFRSVDDRPLVRLLHLNDDVHVPSADTYLDSIYLAAGTDLSDPAPAYTQSLSFDALAPGRLGSRDGWRSSAGARVVRDPEDKGNRVLQVSGTAVAQHGLDPIADGEQGTVFFRMRRSGASNVSVGLTDVDTAPDRSRYADYRAQLRGPSGRALDAADGAGFGAAGAFADHTWQCFWMVTDNATDTYAVYSRGGPYRTLTALPSGAQRDYGFRSPTSDPLDRFLVRSNADAPVLIDDVAIDPDHLDLAVPGGESDSCVFSGSRSAVPVKDPAPGVPQPARLQIGLTPVAQIPSVVTGRAARVNFATTVPGSSRLAVPDLDGVLHTSSGAGEPVTAYLDLRTVFPDLVTRPGLGSGFGSVAFDPGFAGNGIFYTVHTEAGDALSSQVPTLDSPPDAKVQGVITEWTASDPSAPTFAGTHRQVLRIGFKEYTHGLQQVAFDPYARPGDADYGLLYVGAGDGDETPVFSDRPQRLDAPQGKVLRIDPHETPGGAPYSVPADNPFVATPGALGEVYARGLRNPHRFSWDRVTGRMFLANIGEKRVDSVYQVEPGDNFGWNVREGHYRFEAGDPTNVYPLPADDAGFDYPVLQIGRDAGVSLVGGFVYRGRLAALRGHYLFGDIVSGRVRETSVGLFLRGFPEPSYHDVRISVGGRVTTLRDLVGNGRTDLRFGQDAAGELYLMSKAVGTVWKVTSAKVVTPPLSQCGGFRLRLKPRAVKRSWAPLTPAFWRFGGGQVRQVRKGTVHAGPRRPREYAILRAGPRLASFDLRARIRLDRPPPPRLGRDLILVFDYTSARHFAYVHLSNDTHSWAHNGIFVVDGADRHRVDDQYTGLRSAPAGLRNRRWHDVRLRSCGPTGQVAVYVDGAKRPLMTATDTALSGGRVGFGSFDDYGRLRGLRLRAKPLGQMSRPAGGARSPTGT